MSQGKPAIPDPTEIAGRYEVVQRLGAGAMGTVFKARDKRLHRMVAIKTIRLEGLAASVTSLEDMLKRFEVEARTAANLKHPNIVTIYDYGNSEGLSYLALEFIDGVGLDRILSESGKLPVGRAAALVGQVADALDFAHRHHVIHRDIKPANIMIEAGDQVKVTDFGIAKATDSGENLTMTGSLLGTPSYMSPEQARANADLDGRSDLFSLGCVLYELLTGKKAFRGDSITAVLFKIVAEEPPPLAEIDPTIPEEMIRIVAHALSKAPETRYQTGRELADDLRVLAHPGSVPTLRQSDSPTTAQHSTLSFDPTAQGTLATTPTVASPPTLGQAPTRVRPPAPPPVPPVPSVPAAKTPLSRPPAAPAPVPRSARPTPARPKAGGGAGLLLALAGGALVVLLALGVGAWWLLGRRAPAPLSEAPPEVVSAPATPEGGTTAEAIPSPGPAEAPAATSSAPATPPPASTPTTSAPARASGARTTAAPPATSTTAPAGTSAAAPATRSAPPPLTATPPSAGPDDAFLDSLPQDDAPDGRAAGAEVAQGFRSGGGANSSFGSSRSHSRRPVIPKHTLVEQPAVRTLAWILAAQKSHHRRTGGYGSFAELVRGRDLPLPPGSVSGDGFDRRGYRFVVKKTEEGFRADAQPLTPDGGRPFSVDEAGVVLPE